MKKCKICECEKELKEFSLNGKYYRNRCLDCFNAKRRTGRPNIGKFKKGDNLKNKYRQGLIPWNKGKTHSSETKEKIRQANLGKKQSPELVEKRVAPLRGRRRSSGRGSRKCQEWVKKVKERDNWECQKCGCNGKLDAHHIIPWQECEEKRFDIDNGITLCKSCHGKNEGFQKGHFAWATGRKIPEEIRKKISEAKKGTHCSFRTEFKKGQKAPIGAFKKGNIPWNKRII